METEITVHVIVLDWDATGYEHNFLVVYLWLFPPFQYKHVRAKSETLCSTPSCMAYMLNDVIPGKAKLTVLISSLPYV